jgi:hypothetical protein
LTPSCRIHGIAHQHRYRQEANPTRHRRAPSGKFVGFTGINIANQRRAALRNDLQPFVSVSPKHAPHSSLVGNLVHADVNHCGSGLDVFPTNEPGTPYCYHQQVRLPRHCREVGRAGMANCDRGVALKQQLGHRAADNLTATNNTSIHTGDLNVAAVE